MTKRIIACLMASGLLAGMLSACGGGGGSAPATTVKVDKSVALNAATDQVEVSASLPANATVDTTVTLRTTGGARFANTSTHITRTVPAGTKGSNSTTLSNTTAETVTVTAAVTGYSTGSQKVKFVALADAPTRAEVLIKSSKSSPDLILFGTDVRVLYPAAPGSNTATLNAATPAALLNEVLAVYNAGAAAAGGGINDIFYAPTATQAANTAVSFAVGNAQTLVPPLKLNIVANSNFVKLNYDLAVVDAIAAFGTVPLSTASLPVDLVDADIALTVNYYNTAGLMNP